MVEEGESATKYKHCKEECQQDVYAELDDVFTGPAGPRGAAGDQGPRGNAGRQGPTGPQGASGMSFKGPKGQQTGAVGPDGSNTLRSGELILSVSAVVGNGVVSYVTSDNIEASLDPDDSDALQVEITDGSDAINYSLSYTWLKQESDGSFTQRSALDVAVSGNFVTFKNPAGG